MKSIKRQRAKVISVITAVIAIPAVTVYFAMTSATFNSFTKNATLFCAKMKVSEVDKKSENKNVTVNNTISLEVNGEQFVSEGSLWSLDMAPQEQEIKVSPEEVAKPITQQPQSSSGGGALPYPTSLENHSGIIKQLTFTKYSSAQYINLASGGQVRNCTSVANNKLIAESKFLPDFKIVLNSEPQVLIMHTHTTESYEPYTRDFYDSSFHSRTTDNSKNVVAVGDKIEAELKAAGISVIHDKTVHDYPSYNGSYQRSEITVRNILKKYPSIKVVLDVHRDAIQAQDGVRSAPVEKINGKQAAQIMIISGCDDGTMNMPNYMKNFRLSSLLQQQLESDYPGLTRPVLFDYRKYNQDLTTGSILLEMGSHGNSLDEALYSGELMGKALAKSLLKCK